MALTQQIQQYMDTFQLFMTSFGHDYLYLYQVSITSETASNGAVSKEIVSKRLCKKVMSELVHLYKLSQLGDRIPAYDGNKSLYTTGPLPMSAIMGSHQDSIQALDVVMRAAAPTTYVAIGRSFFSTSLGRDELGMGLEY